MNGHDYMGNTYSASEILRDFSQSLVFSFQFDSLPAIITKRRRQKSKKLGHPPPGIFGPGSYHFAFFLENLCGAA
jgi:hypothetical protein